MMESRSFLHGWSCCFRAITVAVMLAAVLSGYVGAQEVPPSGKSEVSLPNPQSKPCSGFSLCQFHPEYVKAGVFLGGGDFIVDRHIAPGAVGALIQFDGFQHRSDTDLADTFFVLEAGFRWGDKLSLTTSVDTNANIGQKNQFRQTTAPGAGTIGGGKSTLGLLYLPNNTKGIIDLDVKNSLWNWDQSFALRLKPKLQLLLGWKYSSIYNNIDSCSATVPAGTFLTFPGMGGWRNNWANGGVPSTTDFTFSQRLWWNGPYLGARYKSGTLQKLPGEWYIEGKFAPYVWGDYEFEGRGYYTDNAGNFISGQQTTQTRMSGYLLELKAGTQFRLVGNLYLELWAKFVHLNMTGSAREMQSWQTNIPGPLWSPVAGSAIERISVNQNFWAGGPNLVYRF